MKTLIKRKKYAVFESRLCCKLCGKPLFSNKKFGLFWCTNETCRNYHLMIRGDDGKKYKPTNNTN